MEDTFGVEGYVKDFIALIGSYLEDKRITWGNPTMNTGCGYENDVFYISAYDWNDDGSEPMPNFWYKPLNFQVEWYKHLNRGTFSNRPVSFDEAYEMFQAVIASLQGAATVGADEDWYDEE